MTKKVIIGLFVLTLLFTGLATAYTIDSDKEGTSTWVYGWASTEDGGHVVWAAAELYNYSTLIAQNSDTNQDYVYTQTSTKLYNVINCSVTSLHQSY